jgi:hypothetical protein
VQGPDKSVTYWNSWHFRPLPPPQNPGYATKFATKLPWGGSLLIQRAREIDEFLGGQLSAGIGHMRCTVALHG